MKVVIGSGNPGKLAELTALLRENGLEPVSGGDYLDDVPETGSSPQENARIKALGYARAAGLPAISMDSGLFLTDLPASDPRQPGTYVRRVGGKRLNDQEMIAHYQALAASLGGRVRCQWVTAFAVALPDGRLVSGDDAEGQPESWKFWLVDRQSGEPLPGKPLSCISLEGDTGIYVNASGGQDGASTQRRLAIRQKAVKALCSLLTKDVSQ